MPVPKQIISQIKQLIPPMDGSLHKGQSGRVGVLGGALDYTGAPFFAAISALRVGVDLSHVICSPTAAGAIKSYSPDLIVHPILREDVQSKLLREEMKGLLSRLHVLIIGPGLGREEYMQSHARMALDVAKEQNMFVVMDADGLYMVGQDLSMVKGYSRIVLTPNVVEFKRLSEQAGIDPNTKPEDRAGAISKKLGGITILQKGANDIICANTSSNSSVGSEPTDETVIVDTQGGMKRCGGQGDILSGAVGALLAWSKCYEDGAFGDKSVPVSRMPLLAATGASMITRGASRRAFEIMGRGVVTQDMLKEIAGSFSEAFGAEMWGGKL